MRLLVLLLMACVLSAEPVAWKVWYDDGRGLHLYHSATHKWSQVPTKAGLQIILVCGDEWAPGRPRRTIIKGADWYWWEPGRGPVAGVQTAPGPHLPKPRGKLWVKKGLNLDDDLFESYHRAAWEDQTCSVP